MHNQEAPSVKNYVPDRTINKTTSRLHNYSFRCCHHIDLSELAGGANLADMDELRVPSLADRSSYKSSCKLQVRHATPSMRAQDQ